MFRKIALALAVAALTTGSALAQFGGGAGGAGGTVTFKHPPNKIITNNLKTLGAKGPKAPVGNSQEGVGIGKTLNPSNSQKGIIAILTGLAKQPGTSTPPAVKSAVPGQPTLKDQMKERFKSRVRNQMKNGKN